MSQDFYNGELAVRIYDVDANGKPVVNNNGPDFKLQFSGTALDTATSSAFNIKGKLAITTQPVQTVAGATMANVVVEIRNNDNQVITTATDEITASINTDTHSGKSSSVSTVSSGSSETASGGIATFGSMVIPKNGVGFDLQFAGAALDSVVSSTFTMEGVLAVATQPTDTVAGATISSVVVEIHNAVGVKMACWP